MDEELISRSELEFHCPMNGELVMVGNDCFECEHNIGCDIYASILNETK